MALEEKNNRLANLLNDESFVRWLRGDASKQKENEWEKWLFSNPERKTLVEKAKKIVSLPFREWEDTAGKSQQLEELMKSLAESSNLKLLKDDD